MKRHEQEQRLSLLLADDEVPFCVAFEAALATQRRFVVTSVHSGEEAIAILKQTRFDVVVLDYRMAGVSGLNVLQWMHEQKIDTPVIMITAAGNETVAVESMKLGAYDYVRKERLDLAHVAVLIAGVYERYLFRLQRELNRRFLEEQSKNYVAVQTFHSTLVSIAQIVDNSLSVISSKMSQREAELKASSDPNGQNQIARTFKALQLEYGAVASAIRSIMEMANTLEGNFKLALAALPPGGSPIQEHLLSSIEVDSMKNSNKQSMQSKEQ
ncbi:MAG: response regulator [bacterium]